MGELDPAKRGAGDIRFVAAAVDGLGRPRPSEARRDPDEPVKPRKTLIFSGPLPMQAGTCRDARRFVAQAGVS